MLVCVYLLITANLRNTPKKDRISNAIYKDLLEQAQLLADCCLKKDFITTIGSIHDNKECIPEHIYGKRAQKISTAIFSAQRIYIGMRWN